MLQELLWFVLPSNGYLKSLRDWQKLRVLAWRSSFSISRQLYKTKICLAWSSAPWFWGFYATHTEILDLPKRCQALNIESPLTGCEPYQAVPLTQQGICTIPNTLCTDLKAGKCWESNLKREMRGMDCGEQSRVLKRCLWSEDVPVSGGPWVTLGQVTSPLRATALLSAMC